MTNLFSARYKKKLEKRASKSVERYKLLLDAEEKNRLLISTVNDIIFTDNTLTQKEINQFLDYEDMLYAERRKIKRRKAIRKLFRRWV